MKNIGKYVQGLLKKSLKENLKKSLRKSLNKRGITTDYLIWILIGLAILVILIITIAVLKGEGISLIDKIKNLFRFR